jgi:flavin reductase (DIM6/NTAB) family NADH-FMN oxidoreductase RutF
MSTAPVEVFRRLTTGVYVVTASSSDVTGGFTAAWVMQVSFEPLLVAVSVNPEHATWPLVRDSGRFVINVLASDQQDVARHFGTASGRDADKFAAIRSERVDEGLVIGDAVAWVGCRVEQQVLAGDHVVLIARVTSGDVQNRKATPMAYAETGNMDGSAGLYPPRF